MISFAITLASYLGGFVYGVPGLLPLAAHPVVRYGRIAAGAGMLVIGLGRSLERNWVQETGYATLLFGLALSAVAIARQPCKDE